MKTFAAFLVAVAIGVHAQTPDIGSLPDCAKTCVENMYAKADELGCKSDTLDIKCLCMNVDFTYGIRDCSVPNCGGDQEKAVQGLAYASALCKANGVTITATDGTSPTGAPGGDGGDGAGGVTTATSTGDGEGAGSGGESKTSDGAGSGVVVTSVLDNGSTTTFTSTAATATGDGAGSGSDSTDGSDGSSGEASPTESQDGDSGTDTSGATPDGTGESGSVKKAAVPAGMLVAAGLAALLM